MANQYFVFRAAPAVGTEFVIENEAAAHHIFTVMRVQIEEEIQLVFDNQIVGLVKVVSPNERKVKMIAELTVNTELPIDVTIAVGFPKGDKLDFIVEKSTELGAHQIWAAPFKWSVVKWDSKKIGKKQEKLEKIALGAAEQSRRQMLPDVQLFSSLSEITGKFEEFDHILVAYEESAKEGEKTAFGQALQNFSRGEKILFIFGPEGGISSEEISKFKEQGAKIVALGPRIMRAETAPLYALSAISTYLELLK